MSCLRRKLNFSRSVSSFVTNTLTLEKQFIDVEIKELLEMGEMSIFHCQSNKQNPCPDLNLMPLISMMLQTVDQLFHVS
jgi:hypothetical protein